jgi:hypothetical protein
VDAINIFELLNSSPCVEDHVTLEQEEMAGEALRHAGPEDAPKG